MTAITKTSARRRAAPAPALPAREDWLAAAEADLGALRQVLLGRLASSEHSTRSLSEALGLHRVYLHRALAGERRLTVKVVFEVLELLELGAVEVFAEAFVLGGPAAEELRRRRLALGLSTATAQDLAESLRALEEERGRITPTERSLRAAELLRFLIKARGGSMREISRQLCGGPDALGQVLRGRAELTFTHVFGALRYLGVGPGRYFFELALSTPPSGVDHPERAAFLDWLERTYEEASRAVLADLDRRAAAEERPSAGRRARSRSRASDGD